VDSSVPGLAPGVSHTVQVSTPRGGNCFDPDCTVTVEADVSDVVMECREDNNTAAETTPG
jgi:subtilase family serine protease